MTSPDSERYFEGIRPEWAGIQFSSLDPLFTRKHVSYLLRKRNIGNILDKNIDNLT